MADERSNERHTGGCLCGAIRYAIAGPIRDVNLCFCTQCQRQTGAPVPAFATVPADQFTLLQGSPATYKSSSRAQRRFCSSCGSALVWQAYGASTLDVFLGTLDDPNRAPPPKDALWSAHRVYWLPALEGIPYYPGDRPDSD